jgi:hypothetical protein
VKAELNIHPDHSEYPTQPKKPTMTQLPSSRAELDPPAQQEEVKAELNTHPDQQESPRPAQKTTQTKPTNS